MSGVQRAGSPAGLGSLCLTVGTLFFVLLRAPVARAETFEPSARLSLPDLEALVGAHSPSVEEARLEARVASAEVRQSKLLKNPELDLAWGTIPIGRTNPENLENPLAHVPNYGVGLSYTFSLGKRGLRVGRATALADASAASLRATTRGQALELARVLGELATTQLKLEGMRRLLADMERQVGLSEQRRATGFGTPLEVDRLRIEVSRTALAVQSEESGEAALLAGCAGIIGADCRLFRGIEEARGFLERWFEYASGSQGSPEARPDVRALAAEERAAGAERALAEREAIPDPTVRVGYLRDQFLVSGAQQNSLNVALSVPLPVFDHGQAAAAVAEERKQGYARLRAKLLSASKARIPELVRRLELERARQRAVSSEVMPRARSVLTDVEQSAEGRLVPLADLIQARRAYSELLVVEADAYGDAFETALELLRETSSPTDQPKKP